MKNKTNNGSSLNNIGKDIIKKSVTKNRVELPMRNSNSVENVNLPLINNVQKKIIKKVIDIVMLILFVILMGYHIVSNEAHEILGIITFILFIIHNILNIKWYKTILKGKYNFYRLFQIIINLLLLIAMLGMMISGIMISSSVFDFLNIKTTMFGRGLHMISTSWGFVLMSIHLGWHLNIFLTKVAKKLKNSIFEYLYYFLVIALMIFGLYTFISSGLWKDMFLVNYFKFFDYDQSLFLFYLGQLSIVLLITYIVHFIFNFIKKK